MSRTAKTILFFGFLAASAGAITLALMMRQSPVQASIPQGERILLGTVAYGGTGCPRGTAQVLLNPRQGSFFVRLDAYEAETSPGKQRSRVSCNMGVPIQVPDGLKVSVRRVIYRGSARVPPGGSGSLRSEYFFSGVRGPSLNRTFPPGYDDDFELTDTGAPLWSQCGEDTIVRINSAAMAEKESAHAAEEARVALGGRGSRGPAITFELEFEDC